MHAGGVDLDTDEVDLVLVAGDRRIEARGHWPDQELCPSVHDPWGSS
jgi:hypothetical protein